MKYTQTMFRKHITRAGLILSMTLLAACGEDDEIVVAQPDYGDQIIATQVEMRDGAKLETYVYLPEGEGPFPTLVTRTIYGLPISPIGGYESQEIDDDDLSEDEKIQLGWPLLTESGYALVIQNTRGRFQSEGLDRTWLDDANDGYDLVEWVNDQAWSDGNIGVFGDSAVGFSALLAASAKPPSLDAVYVQVAPAAPYGIDFMPENGASKIESLFLQGGTLAEDTSVFHRQEMGVSIEEMQDILSETDAYVLDLFLGLEEPSESPAWMALPLGADKSISDLMPFWEAIVDKSKEQPYRDLSVIGKIDVPTYMVSVWQDVFFNSTMNLAQDLDERAVPHKMKIFNGTHYEIDDPSLWDAPVMLPWFDYWLKGIDNGINDTASFTYDIQGRTGELVSSEVWPPEQTTDTTLYLHGSGELLESAPASSSEQSYLYDPANPNVTFGGRHLVAESGSQAQNALLSRSDVLTYASQPLPEVFRLVGDAQLNLSVTSSAPDTDFVVKLLDRNPEGEAVLVLDQLIRLSRRNGRYANEIIQPGEVVTLEFDLGDIAYEFAAGHQLMLAVTSSDFPAWDRNLNTGISAFEGTEYQSATNTLVHSSDSSNTLVLRQQIAP